MLIETLTQARSFLKRKNLIETRKCLIESIKILKDFKVGKEMEDLNILLTNIEVTLRDLHTVPLSKLKGFISYDINYFKQIEKNINQEN